MKVAIDDLFTSSRTGQPTDRPRHLTRWRVRISHDGQTLPNRSFHKLKEAETYRDEMIAELSRGVVANGLITFGEYAVEHWQKSQVHGYTMRDLVKSHLKMHILPHLGHLPMAGIRRSQIQAWVKILTADLAPLTIEIIYNRVVGIFASAVMDKVIRESPCVKITLPKVGQRRVEPLPEEFVDLLLAEVPPRDRTILMLGAGGGLRIGEAFGLEVKQLEFLKRGGPVLSVTQQLLDVTGEPLFLAPPKSEASEREIPMGNILTVALSEHLREFPALELPMEFRPRSGKAIKRTARLVFGNSYGRPMGRTAFLNMWNPARERACQAYIKAATGPVERADREALVDRLLGECTFHDLRHFFASAHLDRGTNIKKLQKLMGHHSAKLTLDTYAHLLDDDDAQARSVVDSVLGGMRTVSGTNSSAEPAVDCS